jgi:hypothetical protein
MRFYEFPESAKKLLLGEPMRLTKGYRSGENYIG